MCAPFKLKSGQTVAASIVGMLFVTWASGSKFLFADGSWGFGLHTMMVGVIGTLLIIATSWVLQVLGRD